MINHSDILQLCRLCLVEEKVNHSIFEEAGGLRGIFLKITSCLPVSISQDDSLPKKICDSCSSKLDTFYQFWNETANAEKQLLQWLNQTTLGPISKAGQTESSKTKMDSAEVKEEAIEVVEGSYEELRMSSEAKTYVLQQQQLPYSATPSKVRPAVESNETEEPAPKRPRRASAMKALEHMGSEEEDDPDFDGDNYTKAESEESDKDDDEEEEDETYQEPSTSMDDQPGPSGMGKGSTDAPYFQAETLNVEYIVTTDAAVPDETIRVEYLDTEESVDTPNFDLYPCDECTNHVAENTPSKGHNMENLLDRAISCPNCKKKSIYRCEYYQHFKNCSEDNCSKIACLGCGKQFRSQSSHSRHKRIAHDKRRFVCEICGKSLTERSSLNNHMRVHSGEKPFMCVVCGKRFRSQKLHMVHQRIHTRTKPFRCKICDKCFTQTNTLKIHMRYHTGERPYCCFVCKRGFVTHYQLKKHSELHL